ncbi:MAG: DUF4340 domain-containing protein [Mariprofundaceae bacterium]
MKKITFFVVMLLLATWILWKGGEEPMGQQTMPSWPVIKADMMTHITLNSATSTVKLQKKEGQWYVVQGAETLLADQTATERLLNDLAAMQPIRMVTANRGKHAELAIDDQLGTVVTLENNNKVTKISLVIGKQGSDLLSTYVRLLGQPEVLAMSRALVWQIKRTEASWLAIEPIEQSQEETKE